MLVNDTAQLIAVKAKHAIKNTRTKVELTPRQETLRRNKIMRKGTINGEYVSGGSAIVECSHQRITAWKRKL